MHEVSGIVVCQEDERRIDRYMTLYGDADNAPDMEKWLELQRVPEVV